MLKVQRTVTAARSTVERTLAKHGLGPDEIRTEERPDGTLLLVAWTLAAALAFATEFAS